MPTSNAISMEFEKVSQAVDHAKSYGGWLFYRRDDGHTFWYDAAKVWRSEILRTSKGSGFIGMWPEVETYAKLYES